MFAVVGAETLNLHPLVGTRTGDIHLQHAVALLHELLGRERPPVPRVGVIDEILVFIIEIGACP